MPAWCLCSEEKRLLISVGIFRCFCRNACNCIKMCPGELQNEVYELYNQSNSVMLNKLTVKLALTCKLPAQCQDMGKKSKQNKVPTSCMPVARHIRAGCSCMCYRYCDTYISLWCQYVFPCLCVNEVCLSRVPPTLAAQRISYVVHNCVTRCMRSAAVHMKSRTVIAAKTRRYLGSIEEDV